MLSKEPQCWSFWVSDSSLRYSQNEGSAWALVPPKPNEDKPRKLFQLSCPIHQLAGVHRGVPSPSPPKKRPATRPFSCDLIGLTGETWGKGHLTFGNLFERMVSEMLHDDLVDGWTNPFEKYARQNWNLPQVGVKIKNIWNHHLDDDFLEMILMWDIFWMILDV